jgi:hypothetical protein
VVGIAPRIRSLRHLRSACFACDDGWVAVAGLVAEGGGWKTREDVRLGPMPGYDAPCQGGYGE